MYYTKYDRPIPYLYNLKIFTYLKDLSLKRAMLMLLEFRLYNVQIYHSV